MPRATAVAVSGVLFAVLLGCGAQPQPSAAWLSGSWRVSEVICSGCGGPVLSLKGKVIELGATRITNPAGEDCNGPPGLQFVRELESQRVLTGPGVAWPEPVRAAVAAHPSIVYGFVTCNGINTMQVALISRDAGYYFADGNAALALTRIR